jgi:integrase
MRSSWSTRTSAPTPSTQTFSCCLLERWLSPSSKTAKTHGPLRRSLPSSLLKIIQASLAEDPRDYLFCNVRGEPYSKNSFCKACNRVFLEIFNKHVTSRILRQSFISSMDFNALTPAEQMTHAKNMCHSWQMQALYRRRKTIADP